MSARILGLGGLHHNGAVALIDDARLVNRRGAVGLIQRLIAGKQPAAQSDTATAAM